MRKGKILLSTILAFGLIFVTGCEKPLTKEEKADYQKLEKQLEDVAVEYFDNNAHLVPHDIGDKMTVQIIYLYKGKYLTEKLVDPITKEECDESDSTITITKEGDKKYKYDAYLECGDYKTPIE